MMRRKREGRRCISESCWVLLGWAEGRRESGVCQAPVREVGEKVRGGRIDMENWVEVVLLYSHFTARRSS